MDIRIERPNNVCDEITDENYIYAPFGTDNESDITDIGSDTQVADETYDYDCYDSEELSNIPVIEDAPCEEVETGLEEDTVPKLEYDALMERYQRLISDWDNYRRRTAEDISQAKANANRNMAEALIPTFDHFGFALAHSSQMDDNPAAQEMAKGFEAIYRAMLDSLSREGLSVIDPAPGSAFNMNENQAVEQVPDTGMESESIVRVVQVGYKFNDYIIRPAMVAVAS